MSILMNCEQASFVYIKQQTQATSGNLSVQLDKLQEADGRYDAVVMDPPSFGRGPGGEVWKLEESLFPLVLRVAEVLSDKPLFFLINSYTTGFAPSVLSCLLALEVGRTYGGHTEAGEIGLPVTETGLVLPCGSSGRWVAG